MEQASGIIGYVKARFHALAPAFAGPVSCASNRIDPVANFPSEGHRAWEDTFVMWDNQDDRATVHAELQS